MSYDKLFSQFGRAKFHQESSNYINSKLLCLLNHTFTNQYFVHILKLVTDNSLSWSGRRRKTLENINLINLHESMGPGWDQTHNPWICNRTRYAAQFSCKMDSDRPTNGWNFQFIPQPKWACSYKWTQSSFCDVNAIQTSDRFIMWIKTEWAYCLIKIILFLNFYAHNRLIRSNMESPPNLNRATKTISSNNALTLCILETP